MSAYDDDQTTQDSVSDQSIREETAGVTLTVLWHGDMARIGRTAWLDQVVAGQQGLSRVHPVFDDGEALCHRGASRSPLFIDISRDRTRLVGAKGTYRFSMDSVEHIGAAELDPDALARGVVLGLGRSGPLVLVRSGALPTFSGFHGMVGSSPSLARVRAEIERLAARPFPVLVRGATGTGKELVAGALHTASGRRGRYVVINVAALPASTAISQLFGHVRGAFTGAERTSPGYFGDADGGTIFLDEIGTASLELQAQLLRVLESNEVQPVGGRASTVDVRVVAATDEDLELAIAEGRFRAPLLHRLAHGRVALQPLRLRPEDVMTQFVYFVRATARELYGVELAEGWLRRKDAEWLMALPWPGNSRELRAVAQRAADEFGTAPCARLERLLGGEPPPDVPTPVMGVRVPPAGSSADPALQLAAALEAHEWGLRPTAEALGISRNTLKRRMVEHGLRRALELSAEEVAVALDVHGDLAAAAAALRVSARALRLRAGELGLAC